MIAFKMFYAFNTTLCYLPGVLLRYAPFKERITKRQKRTLFWAYALLFTLNFALLSLVQIFLIDDLSTSSWLIKVDYNIFGITAALINCNIIKGWWKEHLFTHGFVVSCTYMPLQLSVFIAKTVPNLAPLNEYVVGTLLLAVMLVSLYFPLKKIVKKTVVPFLSISCHDYWKRVWFIPILMFYGMFLSNPIHENISDVHDLISRGVITAATLFFCYAVAADHKILMERESLNEQLNMSKVHYTSLQATVDGARRIRHDHKHLIAAIRHYIETDDKSGLGKFCDNIEIKDKKDVPIPYTGNSAADGIIYHYMLRAREEDVDFEYRGSIKSEGISDVELSVLLGNALDNAFAGALTKDYDRKVFLVAQNEEGQLSVVVTNSFDGYVQSKNGKIVSRKRSGEREGVGLMSMRSICEAHGGVFETKWENDTFTVLMIIPTE